MNTKRQSHDSKTYKVTLIMHLLLQYHNRSRICVSVPPMHAADNGHTNGQYSLHGCRQRRKLAYIRLYSFFQSFEFLTKPRTIFEEFIFAACSRTPFSVRCIEETTYADLHIFVEKVPIPCRSSIKALCTQRTMREMSLPSQISRISKLTLLFRWYRSTLLLLYCFSCSFLLFFIPFYVVPDGVCDNVNNKLFLPLMCAFVFRPTKHYASRDLCLQSIFYRPVLLVLRLSSHHQFSQKAFLQIRRLHW